MEWIKLDTSNLVCRYIMASTNQQKIKCPQKWALSGSRDSYLKNGTPAYTGNA